MKYLRFQIDYVLSRVMVLVLMGALTIAHLGIVYASNITEGYTTMDAFKHDWGLSFMNEALVINEFIFVFIAIYIAMTLAQQKNDALMVYSVDSTKAKWCFVLSRWFSGLLLVTVLYGSHLVLLMSFTKGLTPYQIDWKAFLETFGYLYLEILQYYILTLCFMMIYNYMLMGLISFLVFWVIEVVNPIVGGRKFEFLTFLTINMNSFGYQGKNIVIFLILYIFLSISYIIFIVKKDCV